MSDSSDCEIVEKEPDPIICVSDDSDREGPFGSHSSDSDSVLQGSGSDNNNTSRMDNLKSCFSVPLAGNDRSHNNLNKQRATVLRPNTASHSNVLNPFSIKLAQSNANSNNISAALSQQNVQPNRLTNSRSHFGESSLRSNALSRIPGPIRRHNDADGIVNYEDIFHIPMENPSQTSEPQCPNIPNNNAHQQQGLVQVNPMNLPNSSNAINGGFGNNQPFRTPTYQNAFGGFSIPRARSITKEETTTNPFRRNEEARFEAKQESFPAFKSNPFNVPLANSQQSPAFPGARPPAFPGARPPAFGLNNNNNGRLAYGQPNQAFPEASPPPPPFSLNNNNNGRLTYGQQNPAFPGAPSPAFALNNNNNNNGRLAYGQQNPAFPGAPSPAFALNNNNNFGAATSASALAFGPAKREAPGTPYRPNQNCIFKSGSKTPFHNRLNATNPLKNNFDYQNAFTLPNKRSKQSINSTNKTDVLTIDLSGDDAVEASAAKPFTINLVDSEDEENVDEISLLSPKTTKRSNPTTNPIKPSSASTPSTSSSSMKSPFKPKLNDTTVDSGNNSNSEVIDIDYENVFKPILETDTSPLPASEENTTDEQPSSSASAKNNASNQKDSTTPGKNSFEITSHEAFSKPVAHNFPKAISTNVPEKSILSSSSEAKKDDQIDYENVIKADLLRKQGAPREVPEKHNSIQTSVKPSSKTSSSSSLTITVDDIDYDNAFPIPLDGSQNKETSSTYNQDEPIQSTIDYENAFIVDLDKPSKEQKKSEATPSGSVMSKNTHQSSSKEVSSSSSVTSHNRNEDSVANKEISKANPNASNLDEASIFNVFKPKMAADTKAEKPTKNLNQKDQGLPTIMDKRYSYIRDPRMRHRFNAGNLGKENIINLVDPIIVTPNSNEDCISCDSDDSNHLTIDESRIAQNIDSCQEVQYIDDDDTPNQDDNVTNSSSPEIIEDDDEEGEEVEDGEGEEEDPIDTQEQDISINFPEKPVIYEEIILPMPPDEACILMSQQGDTFSPEGLSQNDLQNVQNDDEESDSTQDKKYISQNFNEISLAMHNKANESSDEVSVMNEPIDSQSETTPRGGSSSEENADIKNILETVDMSLEDIMKANENTNVAGESEPLQENSDGQISQTVSDDGPTFQENSDGQSSQEVSDDPPTFQENIDEKSSPKDSVGKISQVFSDSNEKASQNGFKEKISQGDSEGKISQKDSHGKNSLCSSAEEIIQADSDGKIAQKDSNGKLSQKDSDENTSQGDSDEKIYEIDSDGESSQKDSDGKISQQGFTQKTSEAESDEKIYEIDSDGESSQKDSDGKISQGVSDGKDSDDKISQKDSDGKNARQVADKKISQGNSDVDSSQKDSNETLFQGAFNKDISQGSSNEKNSEVAQENSSELNGSKSDALGSGKSDSFMEEDTSLSASHDLFNVFEENPEKTPRDSLMEKSSKMYSPISIGEFEEIMIPRLAAVNGEDDSIVQDIGQADEEEEDGEITDDDPKPGCSTAIYTKTDANDEDDCLVVDKAHIDDPESHNSMIFELTFTEKQHFERHSSALMPMLKDYFANHSKGNEEYDIVSLPSELCIQAFKSSTNSDGETAGRMLEVDLSSLFVIDTTPADNTALCAHVPSYKKAIRDPLGDEIAEAKKRKLNDDEICARPRSQNSCFNCGSTLHSMRECTKKRNVKRIKWAKSMHQSKSERYHNDTEQIFGHLKPGCLTKDLQAALGMEKWEVPFFFYRMRLFGYPPGWLEEIKINSSGISLFVDKDKEEPIPNLDEGEVDEKELYDIRNLYDFPGFNVKPKGSYRDDYKFHGCPPMQECYMKENFIKMLGDSVYRGHRRKKLMDLPQATISEALETDTVADETTNVADMEIEDSDTIIDKNVCFAQPSPPIEPASNNQPSTSSVSPLLPPPPPKLHLDSCESPPPPPNFQDDDIELQPSLPKLRKLNSAQEQNLLSSPSLKELEAEQTRILQQLRESSEDPIDLETGNDNESAELDEDPSNENDKKNDEEDPTNENDNNKDDEDTTKKTNTKRSENETKAIPIFASIESTPLCKFSPYDKLPDGENFKVGVSDVINFENLPDSTGAYEKMKTVLKKVRNCVTKLQNQKDD